MDNYEWQNLIIAQTKELGTYKPSFDSVIETLASILEKRDQALKEFEDTGAELVTEFVSDRGATNLKRNPRLQVWQDLNSQALAYWRDLGLTPAGLKKLKDLEIKSTSDMSGLERALNGIARELGQGS
jgi:hypothetical protein